MSYYNYKYDNGALVGTVFIFGHAEHHDRDPILMRVGV